MDREIDFGFKFAKYDRKLLTGAVMEEKPSRILQRLAEQHGGVLNRADLALTIGELFAANVYGEQTMAEQRPFDIRDDGDRWTVYGSYNREMKPGDGPLKVVLRKWDGAVLDIAVPMIYTIVGQDPSPEELARPREERLKDWLDEKPGSGGFGGLNNLPLRTE
jgi:hypothetical protein